MIIYSKSWDVTKGRFGSNSQTFTMVFTVLFFSNFHYGFHSSVLSYVLVHIVVVCRYTVVRLGYRWGKCE